jgi:hypothetical protein
MQLSDVIFTDMAEFPVQRLTLHPVFFIIF